LGLTAIYPCFQRAQDALFETCDALLTEPAARGFVELSLSPRFTRRWPSLYAALKDGRIDRATLQRVVAQYAPLPSLRNRLLLGLDAMGGWDISSLDVLPETPSSWMYVLDNQRIPIATTAGQMGAGQLAAVTPHLLERALLVADRYYGSAKFVAATAAVDCDKLLRIPGSRVFYRPAPRRRKHQRGAPKKDGPPFKCKDARTHRKSTSLWQGIDDQGHKLEVAAWAGLHYKQCRDVTLTVIRVIRHGASNQKRDPRVSWFIWVGRQRLPLRQVWKTYRRRYGHEHDFRGSLGIAVVTTRYSGHEMW
jgi:hypothetical protein